MELPGKLIEFESKTIVCRGRHLHPECEALSRTCGAPCVVMGHGFGGTIEAGLFPFAEQYAKAGCHVVLFDYRHFGSSDGVPRQLLSIRRQLEDWKAAVAFSRMIDGVDPNRIALMGTSFSGGHVVVAAARDGKVAAVISQCPMMDGSLALFNVIEYAGLRSLSRIIVCGVRDVFRPLTGRPPLMLPIVGPPGSLAAMTTPDAEPGYYAIAPPDFRNEVCARIALTIGRYRPGLRANHLPCPILIQVCELDAIAPPQAADVAARRAGGHATIRHYPIAHFDIYVGEAFDRSVHDQVEFLVRALS